MYTDVISHCHYDNYIQITSSSFNGLQCAEFETFGELGLQRSLKLATIRFRAALTLKSILRTSCQSWLLYPKHWNKPTRLTCRSSNKEGEGGDRNATGAYGSSDVAVNCQKPSSMELFSINAAVVLCLTDLGLDTMSVWPLAILPSFLWPTG